MARAIGSNKISEYKAACTDKYSSDRLISVSRNIVINTAFDSIHQGSKSLNK